MPPDLCGPRAPRLGAGLVVLLLLSPSPAGAQILPQRPLTWFGGRVVIGASVSMAAASSEEDTYFNSGDYEEDTMRLFQAALTSSVVLHPRVVAEAELRAGGEPGADGWYFRPRTLVLRVHPFGSARFGVEAGLLQTAFGSASGRSYGRENLLIGRPLVYQYVTALRGDALPRHLQDLIQNRGLGAEAYYFLGDIITYGEGQVVDQHYVGLPLADPNGWNAGLRVTTTGERVSAAASVTDGSLSNPRSRGASGGWQASGRVEVRPLVGWIVGASVAHGRFLHRALDEALVSRAVEYRQPRETALGLDVEYSRDYWLLRAEAIHSRRTVPGVREPLVIDALTATGLDLEGRYRLAPGLYVAARLGSLFFGRAAEGAGSPTWDANVFRIEAGPGWSVTRGLLVKATYQYNRRDMTGPLRSAHRVAVEATAWF